MKNTNMHNELLEDFDLYTQLIKKGATLPWMSPHLLHTIVSTRDANFELLNELTRPSKKGLRELLAEKLAAINSRSQIPTRQENMMGYEIDGEFFACSSCLDIWRNLLKKLWNDYPDKREIMAASVKRFGYNRGYISSNRKNLFVGKADRWIRIHSRVLIDGWYMDVNVNPERIQKLLPVVISSVSLVLGKDVAIIWK